jgi:hypothetical protein
VNDKQINEVLDQLKNRSIAEYYVQKDDFLNFRKTLVKREDFKHFRGIAQHKGAVIYQYIDVPRS